MRVFVVESIFRQAGVGEIDVCCWGLAHHVCGPESIVRVVWLVWDNGRETNTGAGYLI